MIRRILMAITQRRPMKTIIVNDAAYLERYYLGGLFGYQVWLHRFVSADSERHLHSHPWSAVSIVLAGRYVEHYRDKAGRLVARVRVAFGKPMKITPDHVHRIIYAEPDTWTLMLVGRRRLPTWYFIKGGQRVAMQASPARWWTQCRRGAK